MSTEDQNKVLSEEELKAKIEAEVEARLKPIKEKLDGAYSQRDAALQRADAAETKAKELEIQKLKESGNELEAARMELAEAKARAANLEKRNTELERDNRLRAALNGLSFRNDRAARSAFNEISQDIIIADGEWKHKSGTSIEEAVRSFSEDKENSFLFAPPNNSGAGSDYRPSKNSESNSNKSLFKMSQAEVLKLAKEGKLPNQRK